jgi:hypothetical protein
MFRLWKKKQQIQSDEYKSLEKKIIEISDRIERLELNFALFKKQQTKKVQKILNETEENSLSDPYEGVIGYKTK